MEDLMAATEDIKVKRDQPFGDAQHIHRGPEYVECASKYPVVQVKEGEVLVVDAPRLVEEGTARQDPNTYKQGAPEDTVLGLVKLWPQRHTESAK